VLIILDKGFTNKNIPFTLQTREEHSFNAECGQPSIILYFSNSEYKIVLRSLRK